MVHDEEDVAIRDDEDGEGLDVVGLDSGSHDPQRRPSSSGNLMRDSDGCALAFGDESAFPCHLLFTART